MRACSFGVWRTGKPRNISHKEKESFPVRQKLDKIAAVFFVFVMFTADLANFNHPWRLMPGSERTNPGNVFFFLSFFFFSFSFLLFAGHPLLKFVQLEIDE